MSKIFVFKTEEMLDESTPFSGTVEIEIPTYKERITLCQSIGLTGSEEDKTRALKIAEASIALVEARVKKVDLVIKATKEIINSLQDLSYYKEGSEIIGHINSVILNGIPLGKN